MTHRPNHLTNTFTVDQNPYGDLAIRLAWTGKTHPTNHPDQIEASIHGNAYVCFYDTEQIAALARFKWNLQGTTQHAYLATLDTTPTTWETTKPDGGHNTHGGFLGWIHTTLADQIETGHPWVTLALNPENTHLQHNLYNLT